MRHSPGPRPVQASSTKPVHCIRPVQLKYPDTRFQTFMKNFGSFLDAGIVRFNIKELRLVHWCWSWQSAHRHRNNQIFYPGGEWIIYVMKAKMVAGKTQWLGYRHISPSHSPQTWRVPGEVREFFFMASTRNRFKCDHCIFVSDSPSW